MFTKKILKSKVAEKGIIQVIENAFIFNKERIPVKIKEIGVGGSAFRTERPRDIDIIVRAEFEKGLRLNPNLVANLKRFICERLSQGWRGTKLDFHILASNSAFSDRWIPGITVWNSKKGYLEIDQKIDSLFASEFRQLSAIVKKMERHDKNLPSFFSKSMNLMNSIESCEIDTKFKNYLNRKLNEIIQLCKSRGEVPLRELNTILRSEMKKFALAGHIHNEFRKGFFDHKSVPNKFADYGFTKKELTSILIEVLTD